MVGGVATLFTGLNFWGRPAGKTETIRETLEREFLNLETTNLSRSKAVGHSYLQEHKGEANPRELATTIAESCHRQNADPARRDDYDVKTQIRTDFMHGRTVEVNGWILSRTEARLYALVSLS